LKSDRQVAKREELFMPPCGATFDENSPLSGGVSAYGRWGGLYIVGKAHPGCLRDHCRCGSHPSDEGDFRRSRARRHSWGWKCAAVPTRG